MSVAPHTVRIRTPEGAEFSYLVASPMLRLCALFVDWMVIIAAWSLLSSGLLLLNFLSADLAGWMLPVTYLLLSFGYDIAFEWLCQGRSLGKRLMSLRVVDARGLRLSFPQIVLRNVLRIVDAIPALYACGGAVSLLTERGQRVGDLVADTLVIWEPPVPEPDAVFLQSNKYNTLREQAPVVARLRQSIPREQARAAWEALLRRDQFDADARLRLFGEIAAEFRHAGKVPAALVEGLADEQFVRDVVEVIYH